MAVVDQNNSTETRRACNLQVLALYLNEVQVKEYRSEDPDETRKDLDWTVIGIYVLKSPGADGDQLPEDVGIIVEGVQVLHGLKDVATACARLFGIIYDLNLSYPADLW